MDAPDHPDHLHAAVRLAGRVRELSELLVSHGASEESLIEGEELVARAVQVLSSSRSTRAGRARDLRVGGQRAFTPVLGVANPLAPPMTLRWESPGVVGECRLGSAYEGPEGCAHGGVSALLLDEVTARVPELRGLSRVTMHLGLDYRRPVPLHHDLRLTARHLGDEGSDSWVRGEIALRTRPQTPLVVADVRFRRLSADDLEALLERVRLFVAD